MATNKEITEKIKEALKFRNIKIASAARMIGKSPQNLNNILRGNRHLSQSTAELFHREFGWSIQYMRFGIGQLEETTINSNDHRNNILLNIGYVFPLNDNTLTEKEKEWNRIAYVLKNTYIKLNNELPQNVTTNVNKIINQSYISKAKTEKEKRSEATIILYSQLIRQITDEQSIFNKLKEE